MGPPGPLAPGPPRNPEETAMCNCNPEPQSRERRDAADKRQQAAREGRDVQPKAKPDAGRVER